MGSNEKDYGVPAPDVHYRPNSSLGQRDHSARSGNRLGRLGQIYSALAYYWDHQEELDQDIERRLEFVDRVQRAMGPSPLVARLKAKGENW